MPGVAPCQQAAANTIPGPLALIELGAAAGLCLLPDRYSYRYSDGRRIDPPDGPSSVLLDCTVAGPLPCDLAVPQIVSRIGVDLNPLDPADPDSTAWLRNLVCPEHEHRRERLNRALVLAAADPPRVLRGNLLEVIAPLVERTPDGATPVVLHCAALAYLDQDSRATAYAAIRETGARWVSFEARGVLETVELPAVPATPDTQFVAALDEVALAVANGHGDTATFLD